MDEYELYQQSKQLQNTVYETPKKQSLNIYFYAVKKRIMRSTNERTIKQ